MMGPSAALLAIAERFDALPLGSAPAPDRLTLAHAAGVLRRLAPRVASADPVEAAKAVGQIRSVRWSAPSAAAALWEEAVEVVAGMGGAGPEPGPTDPRAVFGRALEDAYRRGLEDGVATERAQCKGYKRGLRDGFEQARERAAKIADGVREAYGGDGSWGHDSFTKEIRALEIDDDWKPREPETEDSEEAKR